MPEWGWAVAAAVAVIAALIWWEERRDRKRQAAFRAALRANDWTEVDRQMGLAPPINPLEPTYSIQDGGRGGHD